MKFLQFLFFLYILYLFFVQIESTNIPAKSNSDTKELKNNLEEAKVSLVSSIDEYYERNYVFEVLTKILMRYLFYLLRFNVVFKSQVLDEAKKLQVLSFCITNNSLFNKNMPILSIKKIHELSNLCYAFLSFNLLSSFCKALKENPIDLFELMSESADELTSFVSETVSFLRSLFSHELIQDMKSVVEFILNQTEEQLELFHDNLHRFRNMNKMKFRKIFFKSGNLLNQINLEQALKTYEAIYLIEVSNNYENNRSLIDKYNNIDRKLTSEEEKELERLHYLFENDSCPNLKIFYAETLSLFSLNALLIATNNILIIKTSDQEILVTKIDATIEKLKQLMKERATEFAMSEEEAISLRKEIKNLIQFDSFIKIDIPAVCIKGQISKDEILTIFREFYRKCLNILRILKDKARNTCGGRYVRDVFDLAITLYEESTKKFLEAIKICESSSEDIKIDLMQGKNPKPKMLSLREQLIRQNTNKNVEIISENTNKESNQIFKEKRKKMNKTEKRLSYLKYPKSEINSNEESFTDFFTSIDDLNKVEKGSATRGRSISRDRSKSRTRSKSRDNFQAKIPLESKYDKNNDNQEEKSVNKKNRKEQKILKLLELEEKAAKLVEIKKVISEQKSQNIKMKKRKQYERKNKSNENKEKEYMEREKEKQSAIEREKNIRENQEIKNLNQSILKLENLFLTINKETEKEFDSLITSVLAIGNSLEFDELSTKDEENNLIKDENFGKKVKRKANEQFRESSVPTSSLFGNNPTFATNRKSRSKSRSYSRNRSSSRSNSRSSSRGRSKEIKRNQHRLLSRSKSKSFSKINYQNEPDSIKPPHINYSDHDPATSLSDSLSNQKYSISNKNSNSGSKFIKMFDSDSKQDSISLSDFFGINSFFDLKITEESSLEEIKSAITSVGEEVCRINQLVVPLLTGRDRMEVKLIEKNLISLFVSLLIVFNNKKNLSL